MLRRLTAFTCLLLLTFSACTDGGSSADDPGVPQLQPGQVVDTTPEGFETVLVSLEGKPVVVNWWASWCPPCIDEMPLLVAAANEHDGELAFLGVNTKDDPDAAEEFMDRFEVPYPSVGDPDGAIMRDQKIVGLPVIRFYRSDGVMAFAVNGGIDEETLNHRIDELLRID